MSNGFQTGGAYDFKTSFAERLKEHAPEEVKLPSSQERAESFKSNWVDKVASQQPTEEFAANNQVQQASNNAAAIHAQDMQPSAAASFDTDKWGYNAGSAPKYESMDSDVQKRVAGLDYSVNQDRNYWAAKADSVRADTYGDVWSMPSPNWNRPDDPEPITTTWQDRADEEKEESKSSSSSSSSGGGSAMGGMVGGIAGSVIGGLF